MIWLLSLFEPCEPDTEKMAEYLFLPAFVLIIAYSGFRCVKRVFPARSGLNKDLIMPGYDESGYATVFTCHLRKIQSDELKG